MDFERRLARLEALEAIRLLKHRYLNACDLKEVETVRDCFATDSKGFRSRFGFSETP